MARNSEQTFAVQFAPVRAKSRSAGGPPSHAAGATSHRRRARCTTRKRRRVQSDPLDEAYGPFDVAVVLDHGGSVTGSARWFTVMRSFRMCMARHPVASAFRRRVRGRCGGPRAAGRRNWPALPSPAHDRGDGPVTTVRSGRGPSGIAVRHCDPTRLSNSARFVSGAVRCLGVYEGGRAGP